MDVFERGENFGAVFVVRGEPGDVFLSARNLGEVEERQTQPASKHTPAHRRARLVERRKERRCAARALEDFETANGLLVEHHEGVGPVAGEARQLLGDVGLRLVEVGDDRGGGGDRERAARESEGRERARVEVLLDDTARSVQIESGVGPARDEAGEVRDLRREALRHEQFGGRDALKLRERRGGV